MVPTTGREATRQAELARLTAENDPEGEKKPFEAFFASIPRDRYRKNDIAHYEGYWAAFVYSHFAAALDVRVEESTARGRLDMAVLSPGCVHLLIPYIARLLTLPGKILVPLVLFFSLCGVYLVSFNTFDIQMMVFFAVAAIALRLFGYPMAPLILGFVLGRMIEENLRRALEIHDGYGFLWERPITAGIMLITILVLIAPLLQWRKSRKSAAA